MDVFETEGNPTNVNVNESLAILQYIEVYHNAEVPLLPPVSNRAARALALCRMQETENLHNAYDALEDAYFESSNSGTPLMGEENSRLVDIVQHELDYWEFYAGKTSYIADDDFGLADCAFFPLLGYMVHRGFDWRRQGPGSEVAEAWPNLKKYFGRVWDRGGEDGPAQKAQPDGWQRRGKANVWRGTRGSA